MIITDSIIEKLSQPGLWFVKSRHTCMEISKFVYEIAYQIGLPVLLFTSCKREIQNNVIAMIGKDYVNSSSDENERSRLEHDIAEYNTHGIFGCQSEMNDYVENGSFWSGYAYIDDGWMLGFQNYYKRVIFVDGLEKLQAERETELSKIIQYNVEEAKTYDKTVIVFVSENYPKEVSDIVENNLFV